MASPAAVTSSAGDKSSTATPSPAHPETWTQEERRAALLKEIEVYEKYMSDAHTQATDAIHNFKKACEARNVHYADAFLTGDMTAEEYKKVDSARRVLMLFWKEVRKLYKACQLTADGDDFFSPNKRWFHRGNEYRALVEPLDIANWYKNGNNGHYWDTLADGEEGKRPSQYAFLDRLMKDSLNAGYLDYVNSVDKAKEYKAEAKQGQLKLQTVSDARADPPKGFLRHSLQLPGPGDLKKPPQLSPESPTGVLEKGEASNPTTPMPEPLMPAPQPTPTPPTDLPDAMKSLAIGTPMPSSWRPGVTYVLEERIDDKKIRGYPLPEPIHEKRSICPVDFAWDNPKSNDIEVKYGMLVYKAGNRKYLTVRVQVHSSGKMVHGPGQHDGRYCGYYQASQRVSVHPARVKGDTLSLVKDGIHPSVVVPKDLDVKISESATRTWKVDFTTGLVADAKKGQLGGSANLTAGLGGAKTKGKEVTGSTEPFQRGTLELGDGGLTWEKKLNLFQDNAVAYPLVTGKKVIPPLPAFATGLDTFDVQGAWSFPENYAGDLKVDIGVQQVLAYSATKGGPITYKFVTSPHKIEDTFSDSVSTDIGSAAKILTGTQSPFTF